MSTPATISQALAPITLAVVIPCLRVRAHILQVLQALGPEVDAVYVVDDGCPEDSGGLVSERCADPRVRVLRHEGNRGVGAAVITGYRQALADGAQVIVKIDGDGQMDPGLVPLFAGPLLKGQADYAKGNRFHDLAHIRRMPALRIAGNAALSFMAKLSTGYWNLFDVTNGYTAIHAKVLARLPLEKIAQRYFFETDMLFHLNLMRATVVDIPMDAVYGAEQSNLRAGRIWPEFAWRHLRSLGRRLLYNYFLRDMTVASLELLAGALLLAFGVVYGAFHWAQSIATGVANPTGTVMLAALTTLAGLQMLLAFIAYDVANVPRRPVHPDLPD